MSSSASVWREHSGFDSFAYSIKINLSIGYYSEVSTEHYCNTRSSKTLQARVGLHIANLSPLKFLLLCHNIVILAFPVGYITQGHTHL